MDVPKERMLVEMSLHTKEWATVPKISDKTDLSENQIRASFSDLVESEHVDKHDIGPASVYQLTEKGKQEAENPSEDVLMMILLER